MSSRWKTVPMATQVSFLSGGTPRKSEAKYWNGDIPWVSSGEMTERRICDTGLRVTEEGAENGTRLVPANTILVVVRGMSLAKEFRISLTGRAATFNQDLKALKPSDVIDPYFLFYYLQSQSHAIRDSATDASHGTKKLDLRVLENWPLPVPDITEQKCIASILSAYDDLIENNRRRIQLLEEAARLLYKEWFVHLRFPGHEHVKIIDGVPEGWEDRFLPEVIDVNPKTPIEKGKEITYVPMSALSEAGMASDSCDYERRERHTTVKFIKNDVLLARITPCLENGKTALAYFLSEGEVACGSTEFIVLRGNRVSHAFTYCLARSYQFRENAIKSMTGSSGRQRVQVSCFDEYRVPLPPKCLLEMFDEVAVSAFEQVRVLMSQNEKLAKARDLLLPRVMSREVIV